MRRIARRRDWAAADDVPAARAKVGIASTRPAAVFRRLGGPFLQRLWPLLGEFSPVPKGSTAYTAGAWYRRGWCLRRGEFMSEQSPVEPRYGSVYVGSLPFAYHAASLARGALGRKRRGSSASAEDR